MVSVIISGVVTGLLYGLVGLGLVVVYRASKVMNFALGGQGVVVAYLAGDMLAAGVPYWVVLPAAVAIGAVLGGLLELLIARPMHRQPHIAIALATLGALLVLEGASGWRWGFSPSSLEPVLGGAGTVHVGDVGFSANRIFIIGTCLLATALLLFVMDRTKFGLSMRAASAGPLTTELLGVSVARVRISAWMLGGAYGCLAAMLVIPLTYLSPSSFTTFLLTAFAAVVLGGLTSVLGVVVGAVLFGVTINLLTVYLQSGLIATYTFIGVALVLVFRPHGLFGRAEKEINEPDLSGASRSGPTAREVSVVQPSGEANTSSRRNLSSLGKVVGWLVLAVVLALVPSVTSESNVFLVATILATFVGVLGLNVVAGFSGQVSLANSAMVAIGAYVSAYAVNNGVHMIPALALAVVAGALAGFVVGFPATRLSGIYLVMFTLMFAFSIRELIVVFDDFTGGPFGVPFVSPDYALTYDQYWLVYAFAAVSAVVVLVAASSSLGRSWRGVRDSPEGARSLGYSPMRVKLGAFTFGNALVGLSGGLTGLLIGYIGPESFTVFLAIYALLAVVLGGAGSVIGSLIGAAFITLVPRYATAGTDMPAPLVFGVVLVLVMIFAPSGLAPLLEQGGKRLAALARGAQGDRVAATAVVGAGDLVADDVAITSDAGTADSAGPVTVVEPPAEPAPARTDVLLRLDRVNAGYEAGLVLRDLSMEVRQGEVVALLGANGAGKSTVLRAVSGLIPLKGGTVTWQGSAVGSRALRSPNVIARAGIGHVPEGRGIFPDLTVDENLRMGNFARAGAAPGNEREQALEMFPILRERLRQRAGTLSGGQQQMLAIARALIGQPKLLMLDEPSLGLAPVISEQVFEKLREIAETGVSVLLVEQNARAALELADRGYVIRRGHVALEGSASELQHSDRLSDSYLAVH
jgi:ABC-type branched-subunit amino acid transport system ATPase component/ABC-type branched-subunit amino acid transport system permease subunit